jgi:hypothetical protein
VFDRELREIFSPSDSIHKELFYSFHFMLTFIHIFLSESRNILHIQPDSTTLSTYTMKYISLITPAHASLHFVCSEKNISAVQFKINCRKESIGKYFFWVSREFVVCEAYSLRHWEVLCVNYRKISINNIFSKRQLKYTDWVRRLWKKRRKKFKSSYKKKYKKKFEQK